MRSFICVCASALFLFACHDANPTIVPHGNDGGVDADLCQDCNPQTDAGQQPQQDADIPDPPDPECGDGIVDPGEECDDGNNVNNDNCPNDCLYPDPPEPYCGDGVVDPGEDCDDGNNFNNDNCPNDCLYPVDLCGNGAVDVSDGEQCDDGNNANGDGCDSDCRIEF